LIPRNSSASFSNPATGLFEVEEYDARKVNEQFRKFMKTEEEYRVKANSTVK
jgi:hypothetical protein